MSDTLLPILGLIIALGVAVIIVLLLRPRRPTADPAAEQRLQELNARLDAMGSWLQNSHAQLQQTVNTRLDAVTQNLGESMKTSTKNTTDHLKQLHERLAVIDSAQKNITDLASTVTSLQKVFDNKQRRGAFGQGRMEAIVRDGLPPQTYEFQYTLSNKTRPDCVIRLPGDPRVMVVDAKFPLESFTAFKEATSEEERRQAGLRIRGDIGKHIRDIADRYFVAGETQDIAILFVPSESIYADLNEHFDDVVQRAHKARIIIVSPSLLMMAIQVMQAIVRDARMREQAHLIQAEVRNMVADVSRLRDRVTKLDGHFRLACEDVAQISTSADKISRRGDRIEQMDVAPAAAEPKAELRLLPDPVPASSGQRSRP
jgi:DNA recombination protein RmuC